MRPATASFVMGGSAWWPSSSRLESRNRSRNSPAYCRCFWNVTVKNLKSAFDSRAGGDRGLRRATQVRVVKVHETVRRSAHFAALAKFVPRLVTLVTPPMRFEHRADCLTVPDYDAMNSADLASFCRNSQAARMHPTSAIAASFPGQVTLERSRAARVGERCPRRGTPRATPQRALRGYRWSVDWGVHGWVGGEHPVVRSGEPGSHHRPEPEPDSDSYAVECPMRTRQ